MKTILLLTGTVAPRPNAHALARTDVAGRIEDYRGAFSHYAKSLKVGAFDRLLFVENSGYEEDIFSDIVEATGIADRFEILSYDGLSEDTDESRFFGECKLLLHAFKTAQSLVSADHDVTVWKVTGRYVVRNLQTIIARSPPGMDFYCHCRNYALRYVDFGVAGFSGSAAMAVLKTILANQDVRTSDEELLRRMIDEGAFDEFRLSRRFPVIPDFSGIRGYDNASYDGWRYRMKYYLRMGANRLAPWLWL